MTTEPLSYRSISFYGRTMAEYEQYFAFKADHYRNQRILDCGAGCASFSAEVTECGVDAIAVDPLYSRNVVSLEKVARMDIDHVVEEASKAPEFFVFRHIRSFEEMRQRRMRAMERFIADYPTGLAVGRYVCAALPRLPFDDNHFDMSLCGHLLFLHSNRLDYALHLAACKELCRVTCGEVRIYPILGLDAQRYEHLDRLLEDLEDCRIAHEIRRVDYEFMRGANQILILKKHDNTISI